MTDIAKHADEQLVPPGDSTGRNGLVEMAVRSGYDPRLTNADLGSRLDRTITAFMELVDAAKHYPCAKKAWVEFLGERPTPLIDRVE